MPVNKTASYSLALTLMGHLALLFTQSTPSNGFLPIASHITSDTSGFYSILAELEDGGLQKNSRLYTHTLHLCVKVAIGDIISTLDVLVLHRRPTKTNRLPALSQRIFCLFSFPINDNLG